MLVYFRNLKRFNYCRTFVKNILTALILCSSGLFTSSCYNFWKTDSVRIATIHYPHVVNTNQQFEIAVNVEYRFAASRTIMIQIYEHEGPLLDQTSTELQGEGTRSFNFSLVAPSTARDWRINVHLFLWDRNWVQQEMRSIFLTVQEQTPQGKPPILVVYTPEIRGLTVTINGVAAPGSPGTSITRIWWDWGDGQREERGFPATHTYARAGTYQIIVTAFQSDGLTTTKTLIVTLRTDQQVHPPYYLFPPYLNLTAGETSSIQLRVIDRNGNVVSEGIFFECDDPSLISVSADGRVTALREEPSWQAGATVGASVDGVKVSNRTVIRVLSTNYRIPYRWLVGNHVAWYFPEEIKGENLYRYVEQYEILRVSDIAYEIQRRLMNLQPFSGALQIFEVEIQEDGKAYICGAAGMNPIRLGWTITGNEWANCFLVPYISPRAPHWGVFFHELGHNFTLASETFSRIFGSTWLYRESIATAIGFTTMRFLLTGAYALSSATVSSLEMLVQRDEQQMLNKLREWLQTGADFNVLEQIPGPGPDIVDGIWLFYRNQRPDDFAGRFFTPLRPQYYDSLVPIINKMRPRDEHTIFAALVSAALGRDLSSTFVQEYHYPLNKALFDEAYQIFLQIMG